MMKVHEEPSLRDQLLVDYDAHEDAVDKAAVTELWALGDWLAEYVPNPGGGRPPKTTPRGVVSISDLKGRRGRSQQWLTTLRKTAEVTAPDRLPQITPRVYAEALRAHKWDLMAANKSLVTKGHRLRDQAGPMESTRAIKAQLDKRTPEERAEVARKLAEDPTVRELLGDEPIPDFGANWADRIVVRIDEQAAKIASLVKREGLVFSPDTPLALMLEMLERSEHRIAEVRAAVQERMNDERAGVI